ncbi:hypothetical protein CBD41_09930 [bacterium TMED181]|nr:MAG: hypothetical protein CBD41_09930 [bacterium TMED181]
MPRNINHVSGSVDALIFKMGAIKTKTSADGKSSLNRTSAILNRAQTGPQGARIRGTRIGSGRSALSPNRRPSKELN